VRDERGDDEADGEQAEEHLPDRHALHNVLDERIERLEQAARRDGLAERNAAHGEEDDGPEEVVEVLLGQDARAEEEHDGDCESM
jgi:hypothetical protein